MNKWDKRFLELAEHVSHWSKDPSTKVGAIIADRKNRIVSLGYNGFPRGVNDSPDRLENRDLKYKIVVHGEVNSVLFAPRSVEGCTVYTWPFLSCSSCTSILINAGIKRIVAPEYMPERWKDSFDLSLRLYKEARVTVFLVPLNELSVSPV